MPHSIQLQSFDMMSSIVRYIASTASSSSDCEFVDLDGPLYLQQDCDSAITYVGGRVSAPDSLLWG